MPKRITYLTKRTDISLSDFRAHWSTSHAAIAMGLPGVEAYRQNHIVAPESPRYGFDGIVELWFRDEEVVAAGIESDVADRLIEDEPRFLSGLVGGAVRSGAPSPSRRGKVWVLGRWASGEAESKVDAWADSAALEAQAIDHAVNVVDAHGPQLSRVGLRMHPAPPQVAVSFCFTELEGALSALPTTAALASAFDVLTDVEVLAAEDIVII